MIAGLEGRKGPQAKECRQPLEAGKGRETGGSLLPAEECSQLLDFTVNKTMLVFYHFNGPIVSPSVFVGI